MGKRAVNLVRDLSRVLLDAAVKADNLVTRVAESGVHKAFRGSRPDDTARKAVDHEPQADGGRHAWDMRTVAPPGASVPPPPPSPPSPASRTAYPSAFGVISKTFDPRILGNTKRQYREARPWVQPSTHIPDGLAQTVLNVPDYEVTEFMDVVVGRYIRTLHTYWIKATAYALRHPRAEAVSDAEFARMLSETPISRFLCRTLDPADRTVFGHLLEPEKLARGAYAKVDYSNMARLAPRPGIFVAPTVTLLERVGSGWQPLAIRINGLTVEPKHTNAYDLSKYFVLQGAANSLVLGLHPNVHFPMDAVNAITRSILPEDHPVRRVLEPHFYMQLPLNYAVLYIDKSLLKNDQREIYTPLVGRIQQLLEFTSDYHRGLPGNSAFPAYQYGLDAPEIPSPYGDFLKAYFEVILEFTTRIVACVPKDDPHVRRWSEHLSEVVAGFPCPKDIGREDTLARAVAFFIWDVAVLHTVDHRGYADESVNKMPFRMRVPPPASLDMPPVDRSRVLRKEDIFRHRMARVMYFKPTVIRRLLDADYGFDLPEHREAARVFFERLHEVDADPVMRKRCPVEELAISIQF